MLFPFEDLPAYELIEKITRFILSDCKDMGVKVTVEDFN